MILSQSVVCLLHYLVTCRRIFLACQLSIHNAFTRHFLPCACNFLTRSWVYFPQIQTVSSVISLFCSVLFPKFVTSHFAIGWRVIWTHNHMNFLTWSHFVPNHVRISTLSRDIPLYNHVSIFTLPRVFPLLYIITFLFLTWSHVRNHVSIFHIVTH